MCRLLKTSLEKDYAVRKTDLACFSLLYCLAKDSSKNVLKLRAAMQELAVQKSNTDLSAIMQPL